MIVASVLVLIALAPLPFGLARDWGEALLTGLIFLLLALWCCLGLIAREDRSHAHLRWPVGCLLAVQAWAFLQAVPLPAAWITALDSDLMSLRTGTALATISLDPYATLRQAMLGVALTALFFLAAVTIRTPRHVQWLLTVLLIGGACQAAYGALMVLTGLEYGFMVEKYTGQGVATGTFVNRNHFAGYLNLCLAAGIGLLIAQITHVQYPNWQARLRAWLALILSPKILLRVLLAVMVVGLVLSRSRMGNLAFFTTLIVAGAATLMAQKRFTSKAGLLFVSLLVVDLFILGQWFGMDALVERLERTDPLTESRMDYAPFLLEYISTFFWTGSGAGSFYGVFGQFHGGEIAMTPDHAHNDYAQFAAEYGLPASLLLAAFVIATGWQAWRLLASSTRLYRGMGYAGFAMIIWLVVHSMGDFNLQIAANAATVMVLAGAVWGCQAARGSRVTARRSEATAVQGTGG